MVADSSMQVYCSYSRTFNNCINYLNCWDCCPIFHLHWLSTTARGKLDLENRPCWDIAWQKQLFTFSSIRPGSTSVCSLTLMNNGENGAEIVFVPAAQQRKPQGPVLYSNLNFWRLWVLQIIYHNSYKAPQSPQSTALTESSHPQICGQQLEGWHLDVKAGV